MNIETKNSIIRMITSIVKAQKKVFHKFCDQDFIQNPKSKIQNYKK